MNGLPDRREKRLEAFLVLQGRSCMVAVGGGVARGGEKKGESDACEGEEIGWKNRVRGLIFFHTLASIFLTLRP